MTITHCYAQSCVKIPNDNSLHLMQVYTIQMSLKTFKISTKLMHY